MSTSDFFHLSAACKSIKGLYLAAPDLKTYFDQLSRIERLSLVNHYFIGNPPYAFESIPLLFDQTLQYISAELQVGVEDIKLIGSAKQGYSIAPGQFGKSFSDKSDLDFTIIDQGLFCKLERDFFCWRKEYQSGKIFPRNNREEQYWKDNICRLPANIRSGFVDHHLLPNLPQVCPKNIKIGETLFRVKVNIESYGIKSSRLSLRVYKDYPSFYKQLLMNTKACMERSGR